MSIYFKEAAPYIRNFYRIVKVSFLEMGCVLPFLQEEKLLKQLILEFDKVRIFLHGQCEKYGLKYLESKSAPSFREFMNCLRFGVLDTTNCQKHCLSSKPTHNQTSKIFPISQNLKFDYNLIKKNLHSPLS
jgi:hypothetical protein